MAYIRKKFPQKFHLRSLRGSQIIPTFTLMNPTPQTVNAPLNLQIWCRMLGPSLRTPSPYPIIKLTRMKIFKTGFRKLSILLKLQKYMARSGDEGASFLRHYEHAPTDPWSKLLQKKYGRNTWGKCLMNNLCRTEYRISSNNVTAFT